MKERRMLSWIPERILSFQFPNKDKYNPMCNREIKNVKQVIWAAESLLLNQLRWKAQSCWILHLELSYYDKFAALDIIQCTPQEMTNLDKFSIKRQVWIHDG